MTNQALGCCCFLRQQKRGPFLYCASLIEVFSVRSFGTMCSNEHMPSTRSVLMLRLLFVTEDSLICRFVTLVSKLVTLAESYFLLVLEHILL